MREVRVFERIRKDSVMAIQSDQSRLKVWNIYGEPLSGKRTFGLKILDDISVSRFIVSFSELANDDVYGFIDRLDRLPSCVLTEFEQLPPMLREALCDYLITLSYSTKVVAEDRRERIWLVTSRQPIPFIRSQLNLPDLSSDSGLHRHACDSLLFDNEVDPECPLRSILLGSTRKLALGQLVALINKAKLLAINESQPVSCHHLSQAFNSLVLPTSRIDWIQNVPNSNHVCDFVFTRSSTSSLDDVIGLSGETRDLLHAYMDSSDRSKILVISGPIGCGKTHVAQTITSQSVVPTVRVTSADILRSKIGDTEKTLFKILSTNKRIIIEDIDKLFPADRSDSNGSVQRCLPVFLSFLDRFGTDPDTFIVGTTRHWDLVSERIHTRSNLVMLDHHLNYETKIKLIKSEHPMFDESSVTQFDLINLSNRSDCIQFAQKVKFQNLRNVINSIDS